MVDWTSSLYLGLEHHASNVPAWPRLSLGKPAALEDPPGAARVERDLAALTGCEAAVLAPSTLHLFVDLIPMLARDGAPIFVDRDAYRTAWWGIRQAVTAGVKLIRFDSQDLRESLRKVGAA